MLLKLGARSWLGKKRKQILVLSEYDPALVDRLLAENEVFRDSSFFFVPNPSEVKRAIDWEMFDYLYAPLEKISMIDKRLFKFL